MRIHKLQHFFNSLSLLCLDIQRYPDKILSIVDLLKKTIESGNTIFVLGNGGSASDAEHFVAELVGRFVKERKGFSAIALTTNSSVLTAIANDFSYDDVFSRQVEAFVKPNDLVFGISTSGNSENVFNALNKAKALGCSTVGLLGRTGGKIKKIVDHNIIVNSYETYHIQEVHIALIHLFCLFLDE